MRIEGTLHLPTNTKVDFLDNSMRKTFIILFLYLRDEDQGERGTVRKRQPLPLIYNQKLDLVLSS